jgi:hypothetical protein
MAKSPKRGKLARFGFRLAPACEILGADVGSAHLEHVKFYGLEKVRCFRIRGLLGFLPNVQGQKMAAPNLDMLQERPLS